jgi:hypothetical protein
MKERVDPADRAYDFYQELIRGMMTVYMSQLMTQDLLSLQALFRNISAPEDMIEEREGRLDLLILYQAIAGNSVYATIS